ncbi:aspartyl/asparaginyl beta-hydroxylase domain-containing protein [Pseudomonas wadenswilerensis]|uniref:aspartyl/asparaginyl beta-hydroxylase domain-containing protein n=1 Tax=Pseudomonas wadenswilerensis TaxID=1785161 RepID=UPI00215F7853|nr:aspartyl/asparaginyl beta-hydroxylase domain-containing protein [Pseudomonas wadenswilerensis]UVM23895.1 aspartyl/asparaginyl beta-hydroxylase domain-containing protein [Pseudomonas wadenswilerensis]
MSKKLRKQIVHLASFAVVAFLIYSNTLLTLGLILMFVACGVYDLGRNGAVDKHIVKKYFLGGGRNTWVLSPFNTLIDLLCKPNKHIYQLHDLPDACNREVRQVIEISLRHKFEIIRHLESRMHNNKRGMLFFQWYGRSSSTQLNIPALQQPFAYVKTVGVSVFNENQSTSFHFGPLRLMLRVLYNISPPLHNEGVYIQVKQEKHYWHDQPLFIFDDTLLHASYNNSSGKRYCLFIDIVRPSAVHRLLSGLVLLFSKLVFGLRRMFYKNWKPIE